MKKITFLIIVLVCSQTLFAQWVQVGVDIDGENPQDRLGVGNSISLSSNGMIMAAGSYLNDGNGNNSGHVRVFENIDGTWTQIGNNIEGETVGDRYGETVVLSADGSIVAIGSYFNDGGGNMSGHVRVFENINDTWTQIGSDIDGVAASDASGISADLSSDGTILAIGSPGNNGNGTDSGQVRIFQNTGGTWSLIGNILGLTSGEQIGRSVSLSSDGTIIAMGSRFGDANGNDSGVTRVYENQGGTWMQIGNDINGEAAGDFSGDSISLSSDGSVLAIGAFQNDGVNGSNSGHVRVYENQGGTWSQIGDDIDGEAASDNSAIGGGVKISSNGAIVAIGAPGNDNANGSNSGHVRVYENQGGTWMQIGDDIDGEATSDGFGSSVGMSSDGSIIAVGAWLNNGNGVDSGHVRVFQNDEVLSTQNHAITNLIISIKDGKIISNLEGVNFTIFNLLGQRIANENLQRNTIYIVKSENKSKQIDVRKIAY